MRSSISSVTVQVTPKLAAQWLERNTHNRPISQLDVNRYASDMKAKKWDLNGEAIIFDSKGTLQDGQHRLWACIEANTSFDTVVVEGVAPEVFPSINTGRKRSPADVLGIGGIDVHRNTVAAAAQIVVRYKRGIMRNARQHVRHQEILDFVLKNAELQEWVIKAKKAKGFSSPYSSQLGAVMFLASRKYPDEAEVFLRRFQSGEELKLGSPILALRNRLLTSKENRFDRLALIVQAWNAFVSKRSLSKMQLPRGDKFPTIIGA